MKNPTRIVCSIVLYVAAVCLRAQPEPAAGALPHLVEKDGRHALIVDGVPYLILGAQCHNSSAWPATLPPVWSAMAHLNANTLEAPIYWEQFEPQPNTFDTTLVDTLIAQAREHNVRLILLWFATWKNGSSHYMPLWMKADPEKYPRIVGIDGKRVDSPSPHSAATLTADARAFRALMKHLRQTDTQHTVIMVQVENEPGAWNSVRDYSPAAQRLFEAAVPTELISGLKLTAAPGAGWAAVFGADADEYFHAWSVARFIGQVAAAGKEEYPLPLYVNAALRDPLSQPPASTYESGGPTDNVLGLWKIAAPAIDVLAPDIYLGDTARYAKVLELYGRRDNALFVPETSRGPGISRYCYTAFAHGAIGWSPFGVDDKGLNNSSSGLSPNEAALEPFAANYRILAPMMREMAQFVFDGRVHAAVEEKEVRAETIALGRWQAIVSFGPPVSGYGRNPKGNPEPIGRAMIVPLGNDEFLVTGYLARVDFKWADASSDKQREFVRVEEGRFEHGVFKPSQIWNGDETDWALNFGTSGHVLRVRLGTY